MNVFYLLATLMSIDKIVSACKFCHSLPDLCKEKDRDDFNLTLRASFLFRNSLILIDQDWFVYTAHNHTNINQTYSQLVGKPFEEYWPAFKEYPEWKDIKPNVISIYHVDMRTPFMYMFAKGVNGVCYNMNTSKFSDVGRPKAWDTKRSFITDNGETQFVMRMDSVSGNKSHLLLENGNITWNDDGKQNRTVLHNMGYMYYTWNRTTPNLKNITVIYDQEKDPSKAISPDFEIRNLALDWDLPTGFVYEVNFYFFGHKNVYTFPVYKPIAYPKNQSIRATNPVKMPSVKDYFNCVHFKTFI